MYISSLRIIKKSNKEPKPIFYIAFRLVKSINKEPRDLMGIGVKTELFALTRRDFKLLKLLWGRRSHETDD